MIDCSRLIERHAYYFRLLDFMADWGYDTLMLHFSDDNGLSVRLPGFSNLAARHAFSAAEIKKLVRHAKRRGIDVIPELETFGHTRFLTDNKKYAHLFAGKKTKSISFNALDPLNPESHALMEKLMRATAKLFPSKHLHIGCDEVNLVDYCKERGLDTARVWMDYVNQMIAMARRLGKRAVLWADRDEIEPRFSQMLDRECDKDALPVFWHYSHNVSDRRVKALKRAGFKTIWLAPAVAASEYRCLPARIALKNVERMARYNKRHGTAGLLLTVWEPYRYVQGAAYYGIAYAAEAARLGRKLELNAFHEKFARRVFGTRLESPLASFLRGFPDLEIRWEVAQHLAWGERGISDEGWRSLEKAVKTGKRILPLGEKYEPKKNKDIWVAMQVAALTAWVFAEHLLIGRDGADKQRREAFNLALERCQRELAEEWDRTRFPDDPGKWRPSFPNKLACYILPLAKRLKKL